MQINKMGMMFMTRIIENFNQDWLFCLGVFDKDSAAEVCLPHTVSLTPASVGGCVNYQGICTYQKDFLVPVEYTNKKLILEFEGAMGVTQVSLNDELIYTHYCGYTPIVVDITDKVRIGETNTVKLSLDNSDNEDVPPGKAQGELDFNYDGGLYREARLIITDKLYITHALLANEVAGGGIFVHYSEVLSDSANVHVKVHVKNETDGEKSFCVRASLYDGEREVGKASNDVCLNTGASTHTQLCMNVLNPKLWSTDSPNLYNLKTEVVCGGASCDCVVCDCIEISIGIRTFEFTYDRGVIFNGVEQKFSGANYHQTYPYIGNGVPSSLLRRDAMKLKDIGMQNIRSHYPFATAFTDACNELGLTLIISAPGWQWFKEGVFVEHCYKNIRDIVRWQRNNPSIIIWEPLLNETPVPEEFQQNCNDIVHQEYPYPPCYTASDHGPTDISYREYDPGMLQPGMEGYSPLKRYGEKADMPVWIREYGDAPDNWTDQNCSWRVPRGWGDFAMLNTVYRMLGMDAQCPKNNYLTVLNKPNICGFGVWPGIEHNRGYHINPCWGGFMDLFRVPKFSYHFMKSQLPVEKAGIVLEFATWWTEVSPDDVVIFSNADSIRLYHDDVLVGEQTPDDFAVSHPPFTFKAVRSRFKTRERSVLKAEAIIGGRVVATKTIKSPGVPVSLSLEADFSGINLKADGSDIVLVYCKILDIDGNTVPLTGDRHPILFTIEGEGEIVGDSAIWANPICAEAGIATVLVRSTKKAGVIKLTASMLWNYKNQRVAIKPDTIELQSYK